MRSDPVNKSADVGVDTGLVLLPAAVAPAHHANDVVGPIALTHQGAPRVTLQGHGRDVFNQGSLVYRVI